MADTYLKPATDNVNKKYNEYFLPTLLTAMATNLGAIVDSAIAGNLLGSQALAAIGLFMPINQLLFAATIFLGMGGSVCIANEQGQGHQKKADGLFSLVIMLIALLCVLCAVLLLVFRVPIVDYMAGDSGLKELVDGYYLPYVLGVPLNIVLGSMVYYIRLDGRPKFTTAILAASQLINLLFDFIFMGVFKTGIGGASAATDLGLAAAVVMIAAHYMLRHNTLHLDFDIFKAPAGAAADIVLILSTGVSGALGALLISVRAQFFNRLIMSLSGSEGLAHFSVCTSTAILASMFITGASQTMMPIVSTLMGEGDYAGIRRIFKHAVLILTLALLAVIAFIEVWPAAVLKLFGIAATDAGGIAALRLNSFSFFFDGITFIVMYLYVALGKKALAAAVSPLKYIVFGIPAAWLMSRFMGVDGVWLSASVSGALTVLVIWAAAAVLCLRSGGRYNDFLLLPRHADGEILSLTIPAIDQSAAGVSEYLEKLLKSRGFSNSAANRLAFVVEGVVENIASRCEHQNGCYIDLRLIDCGESLKIILRDNGKQNFSAEASNALTIPADVNAMAESIEYAALLGWNRLIVKVRKCL